MADNPTGFIDFNAYADLNRAQELEALERDLAQLREKESVSARYLRQANQEAADARFKGDAGATASGTASYGEYLKALQAQQAAAAAYMSNNPMRESLAPGREGIVKSSLDETARLRDYFGGRDAEGVKANAAYLAQMEKQAADEKARKKEADEKQRRIEEEGRAALQGEIDRFWAMSDKRASTFGPTPEAGYIVTGKQGPSSQLTDAWKQRATFWGAQLNPSQLTDAEYSWGQRKK